jgi:hypothetical protein
MIGLQFSTMAEDEFHCGVTVEDRDDKNSIGSALQASRRLLI